MVLLEARRKLKKKLDVENFVRSPDGIELATLCLDCGYKLAESPRDLTRDQILFLISALAYRAEQLAQSRLAAEGVTRIKIEEEGE